jgi:hypothetical protein
MSEARGYNVQPHDTLPEAIQRSLGEAYGPLLQIKLLAGGQSGAAVHRLRFSQATFILKKSRQSQELAFYTDIAPLLAKAAIALPQLYWSLRDEAACWLLLEDIPSPLPRERWQANQEMIALLRRLHMLRLEPMPDPAPLFCPQWTEVMTEHVGKVLPEQRNLLTTLQEKAQHLFQPCCLISGDPNPTNWGLRADETLVLFDWERFGYGTPALDLAISVSGLGDVSMYKQVAALYLADQPEAASQAIEQLAHDVALAKVWNVVEYLTMMTEPNPRVDSLLQQIPDWLESLDREMRSSAS